MNHRISEKQGWFCTMWTQWIWYDFMLCLGKYASPIDPMSYIGTFKFCNCAGFIYIYMIILPENGCLEDDPFLLRQSIFMVLCLLVSVSVTSQVVSWWQMLNEKTKDILPPPKTKSLVHLHWKIIRFPNLHDFFGMTFRRTPTYPWSIPQASPNAEMEIRLPSGWGFGVCSRGTLDFCFKNWMVFQHFGKGIWFPASQKRTCIFFSLPLVVWRILFSPAARKLDGNLLFGADLWSLCRNVDVLLWGQGFYPSMV